MLPDELVELLLQSFPCRDEQLRALTALYAVSRVIHTNSLNPRRMSPQSFTGLIPSV